ncbi:MAG: ATP synthase subunit I [Syntrophales bacterium]
MSRTEKDPLQKKLEIRNWIALGILSLIGFVFASTSFALGVLLGGLISIANFYWLYLSLKKAFRNISARAKSFIMVRYYIRFVVTAVVIYFLITHFSINIIGLLIGLSVVVINIVVTTVLEVSKKNLILRTKEVN